MVMSAVVFACDMPKVVESHDETIRPLVDEHRLVFREQPGFGFSYPKPGIGGPATRGTTCETQERVTR
jgi:hypothetical protein